MPSRRDPIAAHIAKWPNGWEAEAERLAKLYTQTVEGNEEHVRDLAKHKVEARELKKLKIQGEVFRRGNRRTD